jgi:L-iditol 2-dehydrogenase
MKAALYKGGNEYVYEEASEPICPVDGLIVEIAGCSVCGTDLKILKQADVKIEGGKQQQMELPRITGHELSGTIVAVGGDVHGYKKGERVTIAVTVPCGACRYCADGAHQMCDDAKIIGYHQDGGFAERMVVTSREIAGGCVIRLPTNVSLSAAALSEPLSCVVNALEITPVTMGDVVVIIGSGPMGCFFVNLARKLCAYKVFLVEISDARLAVARGLLEKIGTPPDGYINATGDELVDRIRMETQGRGADLIVTACPSPQAQSQSVKMVAKRGKINFFGGLPRNDSVIPLDTNLIHYKECRVAGTHGSAPRHNLIALNLISSSTVPADDYITHTLPLERIMHGIDLAKSGTALKILIEP